MDQKHDFFNTHKPIVLLFMDPALGPNEIGVKFSQPDHIIYPIIKILDGIVGIPNSKEIIFEEHINQACEETLKRLNQKKLKLNETGVKEFGLYITSISEYLERIKIFHLKEKY